MRRGALRTGPHNSPVMSPERLHANNIRRKEVDGIHPKQMFDITGAKVAVIGLGRGGFFLSKLAASRGFETVGFDADDVKVAQLETHRGGKHARGLSITSDETRLRGADVFVICASAPLQNDKFDLGELERAAEVAGRSAREGSLVVVETIVYPGVCEHVVAPIVEKNSGLSVSRQSRLRGDIFFAHAPAASDQDSPRVVGAPDGESLSRAAALYRALGSETMPVRSLKEAECVRLLEDAMRDADRALAGEFSVLFDRIGVDIVNVLKAVSPSVFDPASLSGIGASRTSASAYYLARSGHEHEMDLQFLGSARRIVEHMPDYAVKILSDTLREKKIPLKSATVALLCISDQTGDDPGARIREALERKGANVNAFDPHAAGGLKATLEGAQAALIASDDPVFRNVTPRQFEEFGIAVVVDARNCLDKDSFANSPVAYRGIGRG